MASSSNHLPSIPLITDLSAPRVHPVHGQSRAGGDSDHAGAMVQLVGVVQAIDDIGADKGSVQFGVTVQRNVMVRPREDRCPLGKGPVEQLNGQFVDWPRISKNLREDQWTGTGCDRRAGEPL